MMYVLLLPCNSLAITIREPCHTLACTFQKGNRKRPSQGAVCTMPQQHLWRASVSNARSGQGLCYEPSQKEQCIGRNPSSDLVAHRACNSMSLGAFHCSL